MDVLSLLAADAANLVASYEARDRHIVEARLAGFPGKVIAERANLTEAAVITAARRSNGGELPRPRG